MSVAEEFVQSCLTALGDPQGKSLDEGSALAMGPETIHAVSNPLDSRLTSALHVYGGDLVNVQRSMWTEPDWREERYDARRATGARIDVG